MDKDFDFSTAKPVSKVPALQKLRKAHQASQQDDWVNFFDSDVQEVIRQHNNPKDRERLNTMIRVLFATT